MDVDVVIVPGDERGRLTGEAIRTRLAELEPQTAPASSRWLPPPARPTSAPSTTWPASPRWPPSRTGGCTWTAPTAVPGWPRRRSAQLYAGIEHADSFIVDPHKWLFAPYDCCALVYRDPVLARAAHTQKAGYLDPVTVEGEWNPSDFADPADPAGARPAVLVLPRRARHRRPTPTRWSRPWQVARAGRS